MGPIDMQLVPALQSAIDDDALELHYQPEIDLASGAVVGMEALVRWNHPDRGLLWPEDFLPVAEAAGLLALIDSWVLEQGVVELARWQRLGGPPPEHPRQLWVNVSATQLGAAGFADWVGRVISDAGLPPGVLGLEVTEEALARNERVAHGVLRDLRAAGPRSPSTTSARGTPPSPASRNCRWTRSSSTDGSSEASAATSRTTASAPR